MDRAGEKLRRARERLKLTYRDVVQASQRVAVSRGSNEFVVPLSRLADIENRGRTPTIFRLYTLCAIYRLDLHEVLRWYGVPVEHLTSEALGLGLEETHMLQLTPYAQAPARLPVPADLDLNKTIFLNQLKLCWNSLPMNLMNGSTRQYRYGLVGLEDRSMFPILRPGCLVLIDSTRRRIARSGWSGEHDRPIYFLEHRDGYLCGWCAVDHGRLFFHPHPASDQPPSAFQYPEEVEVIGQVVGVAMLLQTDKRRGQESSAPASVPLKRQS